MSHPDETGGSGAGPIAGLLEALAEREVTAADVERHRVGAMLEFRVAGRTAVVAGPDALELRLDARIARAAAGTPDAALSPRGPEWVRFAPTALDRFALDRALSWFDLALKRAAEQSGGPGDGRLPGGRPAHPS